MSDENAKGDVPDGEESLASMQSLNIRNDSPEDSCDGQDPTKKIDKQKSKLTYLILERKSIIK